MTEALLACLIGVAMVGTSVAAAVFAMWVVSILRLDE